MLTLQAPERRTAQPQPQPAEAPPCGRPPQYVCPRLPPMKAPSRALSPQTGGCSTRALDVDLASSHLAPRRQERTGGVSPAPSQARSACKSPDRGAGLPGPPHQRPSLARWISSGTREIHDYAAFPVKSAPQILTVPCPPSCVKEDCVAVGFVGDCQISQTGMTHDRSMPSIPIYFPIPHAATSMPTCVTQGNILENAKLLHVALPHAAGHPPIAVQACFTEIDRLEESTDSETLPPSARIVGRSLECNAVVGDRSQRGAIIEKVAVPLSSPCQCGANDTTVASNALEPEETQLDSPMWLRRHKVSTDGGSGVSGGQDGAGCVSFAPLECDGADVLRESSVCGYPESLCGRSSHGSSTGGFPVPRGSSSKQRSQAIARVDEECASTSITDVHESCASSKRWARAKRYGTLDDCDLRAELRCRRAAMRDIAADLFIGATAKTSCNEKRGSSLDRRFIIDRLERCDAVINALASEPLERSDSPRSSTASPPKRRPASRRSPSSSVSPKAPRSRSTSASPSKIATPSRVARGASTTFAVACGSVAASASSSKPPRLLCHGMHVSSQQEFSAASGAGPLPPSYLRGGTSTPTVQSLLTPASCDWPWEATGASALGLAASGAQSPKFANWQQSNRTSESSMLIATWWSSFCTKLRKHDSRCVLLRALQHMEGRWSTGPVQQPVDAQHSETRGKHGRWRSKVASRKVSLDHGQPRLELNGGIDLLVAPMFKQISTDTSPMDAGLSLGRLPTASLHAVGCSTSRSRSPPLKDQVRNTFAASGFPPAPELKVVIRSSTPRFNGCLALEGRALASLTASAASPLPCPPPPKLPARTQRPHAEAAERRVAVQLDEAVAMDLFRRFGLDECMSFEKFQQMHSAP